MTLIFADVCVLRGDAASTTSSSWDRDIVRVVAASRRGGVTVGASNPQQSALLGDVAVPGGVWSDRRCRKIATRKRGVTRDRLQTAWRHRWLATFHCRLGCRTIYKRWASDAEISHRGHRGRSADTGGLKKREGSFVFDDGTNAEVFNSYFNSVYVDNNGILPDY